jgi:hypothetical protein
MVIPGAMLVFLAHRWRLLRKELLDGTFSDERYHASPGTYMMGPVRQQVRWMSLARGGVSNPATVRDLRGKVRARLRGASPARPQAACGGCV